MVSRNRAGGMEQLARKARLRHIFEGQLIHCLALAVLMALVIFCVEMVGTQSGQFLWLSSRQWIWLVLLNAIIHQFYVWFCWRFELHGGLLSRRFGESAFRLYAIGFTVLFIFRPILIFSLAWVDRGTWNVNSVFGYSAATICFIAAAYTMHSVRVHFSFSRAFGIDHFDESYRKMPFVRKGAFRISPNAMYVFGFLTLWIPAFLFQSKAALVMAVFSHAYIWVHYIATERPDMRHIYSDFP